MSRFTRSAVVLTLSASALASLPAMAADALNYNQISLRAEVSQEVARDKMIVTFTPNRKTPTRPSSRPKSPPP